MQTFAAVEVADVELEIDETRPDQPELILDLRDRGGKLTRIVLGGAALREVARAVQAVREQFPALLTGH